VRDFARLFSYSKHHFNHYCQQRENIQSPARYVANEEYHHTETYFQRFARDSAPPEPARNPGVVSTEDGDGYGSYPGKDMDVSHKIIAVEAV